MRIALPLLTGTAAAAVGFLTLPAVAPAACVSGEAETRQRSSVDSGEIRWTERTAYDDARRWATGRWQYRGARIGILADTAGTVNDMEWRDYDRADGHGGYHHFRGGVAETDYIYLNKRYLKAGSALGSPDKRRAVATHELGHAVPVSGPAGGQPPADGQSVDGRSRVDGRSARRADGQPVDGLSVRRADGARARAAGAVGADPVAQGAVRRDHDAVAVRVPGGQFHDQVVALARRGLHAHPGDGLDPAGRALDDEDDLLVGPAFRQPVAQPLGGAVAVPPPAVRDRPDDIRTVHDQHGHCATSVPLSAVKAHTGPSADPGTTQHAIRRDGRDAVTGNLRPDRCGGAPSSLAGVAGAKSSLAGV